MLILLVGPSGSGKSTLAQYLNEKGFKKLVTTTTRNPRKGEVKGKDYHFTSKENFFNNKLIEFTEYDTEFYGLTEKEIEKNLIYNDNNCFVIMDKEGVKAMRKHSKGKDYNLVVVGVTAPKDELEKRLKNRKGNNKERIKKLSIEIKTTKQLSDYLVVNRNDRISDSRKQLNNIIKGANYEK